MFSEGLGYLDAICGKPPVINRGHLLNLISCLAPLAPFFLFIYLCFFVAVIYLGGKQVQLCGTKPLLLFIVKKKAAGWLSNTINTQPSKKKGGAKLLSP